jgi:hypothetical protein
LAAAVNDRTDSAYFEASLYSRNGEWNEIFDVRRVAGKLISRWVLYAPPARGMTPSKVVLDLADTGFPAEHRHDTLQPLESLNLPSAPATVGQDQDVVFRPDECKLHESFAGTVHIP